MIRLATTGSSIAIASINTTGTPSAKLGRQSTSAPSKTSRTSSCDSAPRKLVRSVSDSCPARSCRRLSSGPSPTNDSAKSRPESRSCAAASSSTACPLTETKRATSTMCVGARARSPTRGVKRSMSTPQWMTWSLFQCSGSTSAINWLRQNELMHTTNCASSVFSASRWSVTSENSVGPCMVKLQVKAPVSAPSLPARRATSLDTSAKCACTWWIPRRRQRSHSTTA
jgi:hypothetical protein